VPKSSDSIRQTSETDLVRRAVGGEAQAFAELYDRYADRVYAFLRRRTPNEQLAEDLTSETFLRAWDHLDSFRPGRAPFGAWLFRVARNLMIDHSRKRKAETSIEVVLLPDDDSPSVEAAVAQRFEWDRLERAMENLTVLQREVLTLRFIEGLETAEVAQVLDRRPGAIRALQMRGLQTLADSLTGAGEDDDD
jgi:RNA polymerase sigma-70 factor (ECF subfamily)